MTITQPTTNTAATQGLARVVNNLDDQVRTTHHVGLPNFNEVLQLAELMRGYADDGLSPLLDRLWESDNAIAAAEVAMVTGEPVGDDLIGLDPQTLTDQVLTSCYNRAARESLAYTNAHYFRDALARQASAALIGHADAVVLALRKDFDKHVKIIDAAAKAGITEDTNVEDLVDTGTDAQLKAYRSLPASVASLDQIAGLRIELTRVLRYGPPVHPVLSFVANVTTTLEAEGLESRYNDRTEVVQYNQEYNGSTLTKVRVKRLGGRWLALATYPGGVKFRLNTADEVTALRDGLS